MILRPTFSCISICEINYHFDILNKYETPIIVRLLYYILMMSRSKEDTVRTSFVWNLIPSHIFLCPFVANNEFYLKGIRIRKT